MTGNETDQLFEAINGLRRQVAAVTEEMSLIKERLDGNEPQKDWYTTAEVAELMKVSRYTVQERWCNSGRIECEKDPGTGKWRIPGREYDRLRRGGGLIQASSH